MAGKSYKAQYEEAKSMLDKYQNEVVPKLREQTRPLTEEEVFALRAVAYGCNTNSKLQRGYNATFLDMNTNKTVSFEDALVTVYKLIERLETTND